MNDSRALGRRLDVITNRVEKLIKKLESAVEIIEFYANESHYVNKTIPVKDSNGNVMGKATVIDSDMGATAYNWLKKYAKDSD